MRFRAMLSLLAAAVAVALSIVVGASPASASGGVCNPGCAASVNFQSNGEIFTVHDNKPDGYSTIGYLWTWNGSAWKLHGSVWNRNGYAGPPKSANYSIAEGTHVAYQACQVSHTHQTFDCSKFYYDKA